MMKLEMINRVSQSIQKEAIVSAAFFENIVDYPNKDAVLYLVFSSDNETRFNIEHHLQSYHDLLFFKANKVGVEAVFDNGLKLIVRYLDSSSIKMPSDVIIIFDNCNLSQVKDQSYYSLCNHEIGKIMDDYSNLIIDFKSLYINKNYPLALKTAMEINEVLAFILHFVYNKQEAKKGMDGIMKVLPEDVKRNYILIINKLRIESLLESVKMMSLMMDTHIANFPIEIVQYINIDFYFLAKSAILNL